ncbi:MAG: adenine deaminase [Chloroflexi bacterium]|nr:adenine deaminase [Chloroflexota bacterium]
MSHRKQLIQAGLGQLRLDLVINNVQIVNVFSGKIEPGAIGIKGNRIVTPYAFGYDAELICDGQGMFALPGFIDTHVHIDSTLLTPEYLSALIVPHGTTSMFTDPMEISNVAGLMGLEALVANSDRLSYNLFIEVPSRVPSAPGLETTGGELGLAEVKEILTWKKTLSLGELDPSKVLGLKDEYLSKVEAAIALGKICNGHTAGLGELELTGYACGGLSDDHECVDYPDAIRRLNLGLSVLIREGSSERNLQLILQGVIANQIDCSNLMFCTDDKHPDDIQREGHIDYMVNQAISMGLEPVRAIQMATINAARHFRVDHLVGSLAPSRYADIILSPSLERIEPQKVIFHGKIVAEKGKLSAILPELNYPPALYKTISIARGSDPKDFHLKATGTRTRVRVIDLIPDQIINKELIVELTIQNGCVLNDLDRDILKLAVVERYGKNGGIGITFVRGFNLKRGAIASSVSHDHHNIVVAGTNDIDMAVCVEAIEKMQGGLVIVVDGVVWGELPLPIGGLMSDRPADQVIASLQKLARYYQEAGGTLAAPFMSLSFISLPTVPELGLTDKGLVDVHTHELISTILD